MNVERESGEASTSEFRNKGEDGAAPLALLAEMYLDRVFTGNNGLELKIGISTPSLNVSFFEVGRLR